MRQILSLQNPKIKFLRKLRERKCRDEYSLMLVEGIREVRLAFQSKYVCEGMYICQELIPPLEFKKMNEQSEKHQTDLYQVSLEVYDKISFGQRREGVIASFKTFRRSLSDLRLNDKSLIVVIDGVEKPGNIGAMIRSCDAAGADAVLLCGVRTDVFNPHVIRASIGSVFSMQVVAEEHENIRRFLSANHIRVVGTLPEAEKLYSEENYTQSTAIIMGSEANGVDPFWKGHFDASVALPMFGHVNSLNVSSTLAVMIYEVIRQRKGR
ncbi:MAG: RNA methyltransferase [Candidatus Omnitrophica bacterium]|nr:RNA methyltransferase [Candidatus Omnitrophota bacterium]